MQKTPGYFEVPAWSEGHQRIISALPVPARRAQHTPAEPYPVHARVVWEHDGEQLLETVAWAWTTRMVLVEVADRRSEFRGVWLPLGDVTRRTV